MDYLRNLKLFIKFNQYDLYNTPVALYGLVLILLI